MTAPSGFLVVSALAGILMMIGFAAWLYRRSPLPIHLRPERKLLIRESIAVDPRRRLHIVQCGSREVILLTGGNHDLVVGWMPEP